MVSFETRQNEKVCPPTKPPAMRPKPHVHANALIKVIRNRVEYGEKCLASSHQEKKKPQCRYQIFILVVQMPVSRLCTVLCNVNRL